MGKASEAGFGNEMYKILTGAALSVLLNRSLIIGQTRHVDSLSSFFFFSNFILFPNGSVFKFLSVRSFKFLYQLSIPFLPFGHENHEETDTFQWTSLGASLSIIPRFAI